MSSTGAARLPSGADHRGDGARGDQRRHAVGGRRRVAQVAAQRRPAADLDRTDQLCAVDDPGPRGVERPVLHDLHAGDRGAEAEPSVLLGDFAHLGDVLDVDENRGLDDVAPHLDQQIGPAGQHLGRASRIREYSRRRVERRRRFVTHPFRLLRDRRSGRRFGAILYRAGRGEKRARRKTPPGGREKGRRPLRRPHFSTLLNILQNASRVKGKMS